MLLHLQFWCTGINERGKLCIVCESKKVKYNENGGVKYRKKKEKWKGTKHNFIITLMFCFKNEYKFNFVLLESLAEQTPPSIDPSRATLGRLPTKRKSHSA